MLKWAAIREKIALFIKEIYCCSHASMSCKPAFRKNLFFKFFSLLYWNFPNKYLFIPRYLDLAKYSFLNIFLSIWAPLWSWLIYLLGCWFKYTVPHQHTVGSEPMSCKECLLATILIETHRNCNLSAPLHMLWPHLGLLISCQTFT